MHSHKQPEDMLQTTASSRGGSRGFSMVELVVVLAVVSVVLTFAVLGVRQAMASIRLQNSMKQFASRVEVARTDAIRRHKSATVEFTSNKKYSITMDFNGTGVVSTREYTLESGVTINSPSTDLPFFDFDWRGRTPQCFTSITMQSNGGGGSSILSVSSAGDVTVDSGLSANMNAGTFTTVSLTGDVQAGAVVSGASPAACSDPCGGCVVASGGSPIQSTPPSGCTAFTLDKSLISIRKNYKNSDSFVISVTPTDTITVVQTDGRTNLEFTPSPTQAIGAGGSKTFTVKSKNNSTGYFPIKFISDCNPSNAAAATVQVTP
jgi:prepilin-type N-terminal cleavage/methylation domain-containing protein